ncbi:MAG: trypsin-like peptidase domain-containing protein [Cyanobacteria bacterium J06634_6]
MRVDELLKSCTVKLSIPGVTGWGTGFFVAPGLILTCLHVVKAVSADNTRRVQWQQGKSSGIASLFQFSSETDLALLELSSHEKTNLLCVYLGEAFQPHDRLYAYGYSDNFPEGLSVTARCDGSAVENESSLLLFRSAQVRPGLSGSPLLNYETGKVCGMVKFTRDRTTDLGGGAIPTRIIFEQFPQLRELQQAAHPSDMQWTETVSPNGIPENLPRSGVSDFVGRDGVMMTLHQMLQQDSRVAVSAIAGMGGIGKTELALQYALNYTNNYPASICWLSVRGADVGTQIVQFGRSLLDIHPSEELELVDQVKFCWRNWPSGDVLMIFDDVVDYAAVEPYFPPVTAPRFKVLVTTRLRLGTSVNQLELEVLDEVGALTLLKSLAGEIRIQAEIDQAKKVCELLGYLPLGLELVGRYLARKPDLLLIELIQRMKTQSLAARALCGRDDDMTSELGIAAAFELSWEALSPKHRM